MSNFYIFYYIYSLKTKSHFQQLPNANYLTAVKDVNTKDENICMTTKQITYRTNDTISSFPKQNLAETSSTET